MNLDRLFESLGALDGAVSNATLRTYRRAVRSFAGVCATEGSEIFPASECNLLRWITSLSKTCLTVTVRGYLVSLRTVHSVMEWPWMGDAISIQHALRKQHRRYGSAQRQTLGITHEMRDAMIDATDPSSLGGVMHRALVRTGYETLFRGAELRALVVGDLSRRPDGGCDIHLRQSKTDQAWSGFWTVVSSACAELLDTWIARAGLDSGYVFLQCRPNQYLPKPLSPKAHRIIYRALAARAGFSKEAVARIGTHSMRVGCAQDMVRHGYSLAQIMRRGNWSSSEMVARYTEATALKPML